MEGRRHDQHRPLPPPAGDSRASTPPDEARAAAPGSHAGEGACGPLHHVVIVGGGFGGLYAAKRLRDAPVAVTLIDKRNFHLFQPLLYQVATGGLSPANIAYPLRATLKRQRNTRVLLGEVVDFDLGPRRVRLSGGQSVAYDTLILAAGATNHYFGADHWAPVAPGLKTLEDATEMRGRVLRAFEAAERETDPDAVRRWLTFVVIGGGPTGVELAGTLAEIARHTLRREFRNINPARARILLLEGGSRLLAAYTPDLSAAAQRALERLGVTVRTGALVKEISAEEVRLKPTGAADAQAERIAARTVLWAAGVRGSPLADKLAHATGAVLDRQGRVVVCGDCTIPRHPEIFVIGDLACFVSRSERSNPTSGGTDSAPTPLPGIAPVAMQQGRYVARLIACRLHGLSLRPFEYNDRGMMATIGRAAAVADIRGVRFSGYLAWLAWLFVHIVFLIEFQNRLLVLTQWAWNYFTWNRSARLITGDAASFELGRS